MFEHGNGVFVTQDSQVSVAPSSSSTARRRRSSSGNETGNIDLDQMLRESEFEIAADLTIAPSRTRRGAAQTSSKAPQIEVDLAEGQDAVILIEQVGGVYRWNWQDTRKTAVAPRRRGGDRKRAVFSLTPKEHSGDDGDDALRRRRSGIPFAGWIGEKLIEPLRVRVLRFVARKVSDALVNKVEGHVEEGPVYWDERQGGWADGLPDFGGKVDPRILLLVHGTFSSTANSFGGLLAEAETPSKGPRVPAPIAQNYDAIIGFDHKTLALNPRENAAAMRTAFAKLPAKARLDAIAFSRGGLVYREFESGFVTDRGDATFGKAVFVGCTNAGTHLANPDNWEALVDLYTTIAISAVRGVSMATGFAGGAPVSFFIKSIGDFVKVLPEVAVEDNAVPGLAAMLPGGEFIASIGTKPCDLARYRAVVSDFRPRIDLQRGISAEISEFIANRVGDRFFGQANDLVVHTASMSDFGAAGTLSAPFVYNVPPADQIYHTIYFTDKETIDVALKLLSDDTPTSATAASPPLTRTPASAAEQPRPRRRRRGGGTAKFTVAEPPESVTNLPNDKGFQGAAPARMSRTDPQEVYFAAQMDADPPSAMPVKLGITISPETIELVAGQVMDRTEVGAEVDPSEMLTIEVMPLSNSRLLTEGKRDLAVPGSTVTEWFLIEGFEPGAARIQVEARQGDRSLALLLLEPVFVDDQAEQLIQAQPFTIAQPGQDEPVYLRIYEIEEPNGKTAIRFNLESRRHGFSEIGESVGLPKVETDQFFTDFLKQLDSSWNLGEAAYANRKEELLDIASETADRIIPEQVRATLWENRDKIEAIQVIADRSTIPWELLSITPPHGGAGDGRFLSEWGLMRRLPGAAWPGRLIDLDPVKARFVIPDYLDNHEDLTFAQKEKGNFQSHFPGSIELEADQRKLRKFLATQASDCSVLHFACHGSASHGSILSTGLKMQEDQEVDGRLVQNSLTHTAIRRDAAFGTDGPSCLVFLNACEAGKQGRHLQSDAVGFADAFLRPKSKQGAAAFVGAMWQVDDQLALDFADTFYREMLSGKTLAEALGVARKAIEKRFDFTWLAFTAYGDPLTKAQPRN